MIWNFLITKSQDKPHPLSGIDSHPLRPYIKKKFDSHLIPLQPFQMITPLKKEVLQFHPSAIGDLFLNITERKVGKFRVYIDFVIKRKENRKGVISGKLTRIFQGERKAKEI